VLGASEVAAVLGLDRYRSPYQIWARKMGLVEEPEAGEPAHWGTILESAIREEWERRSGLEAIKPDRPILHPVHAWACCSPDGLVVTEPDGLEIKTVGVRREDAWGEPGTDAIPDYYLTQVHWSLGVVAEARGWHVAALFGGQRFATYYVRRDSDMINVLLDAVGEWWERHIIHGEEPSVDGSEATARILAHRWPRHQRPLLPAPAEVEDLARALRQTRSALEHDEAAEREAVNRIKALMGDGEGYAGTFGQITWRAAKDGQKVDWEALARSLGATQEQIAQHTTVKVGSRRFVAKWANDDGEEE
jgi:putative phage-type endonuclease